MSEGFAPEGARGEVRSRRLGEKTKLSAMQGEGEARGAQQALGTSRRKLCGSGVWCGILGSFTPLRVADRSGVDCWGCRRCPPASTEAVAAPHGTCEGWWPLTSSWPRTCGRVRGGAGAAVQGDQPFATAAGQLEWASGRQTKHAES